MSKLTTVKASKYDGVFDTITLMKEELVLANQKIADQQEIIEDKECRIMELEEYDDECAVDADEELDGRINKLYALILEMELSREKSMEAERIYMGKRI